jgi:galactose mutarotase-like enzyme/inosine-uridine nucleoside N-ribohydrolase
MATPLLFLYCTMYFIAFGNQFAVAHRVAPVSLIIDTDIGGGGCMDVDDVAAIDIAHSLMDNGECNILAIVQNTYPPKGVGVISVLNHYYHRDYIPIGSYKGKDLSPTPYLPDVDELTANFPSPIKNTTQVPDALHVYRSVLSQQPDHSVTISSIGILTNLEQLLQSPPDEHSALSGYDLISLKVKLLAVMGGKYPSSGTSPECNLCGCAHADSRSAATASRASSYVIEHWPQNVQVLYNGFNVGLEVQSGGVLSSCTNVSNPARAAFINYEGGPNKSRFSWDPLTTLIAVRGVKAGNCTTACHTGSNSVDGTTGNNKWIKGGDDQHQEYLALVDGGKASAAIDALLCQRPKHVRDASPSPPYSIKDYTVGNHTLKLLTNENTGESVDILADWGGKIGRIQFLGSNNKLRDVIYTRCASLDTCTAADIESNATPGAMLIPWANRIYRGTYTFNNHIEHLTKDNSTASQGFLIQGRPMHVVATTATAQHAQLVLGYEFDGSDDGYPFQIGVNITYTLTSSSLTVQVDALNLMKSTSAPFMSGAHPYFKLMHGGSENNGKVQFDRSCTTWNRQWQTINQVPNGNASLFIGMNGSDTILDPHVECPACGAHWDDGFTSLASKDQCPETEVLIVDGDDTMVLSLGAGYRYVQVYSGNLAEGVAVEPMSSETNAWNSGDGLVVLESGERASFSFRIGLR